MGEYRAPPHAYALSTTGARSRLQDTVGARAADECPAGVLGYIMCRISPYAAATSASS